MQISQIVLLTDFGTKDPFAGIMHGVIYSLTPETKIIDLTHGISPQNIVEAAYVLEDSVPYFGTGSLFVCVVDPGVGSNRSILLVETSDYAFLAPDNGLLAYILAKRMPFKVRKVENLNLAHKNGISRTFHGRDIFAPVAAALAKGLDPCEVGPETSQYVSQNIPFCKIEAGMIHAEIIGWDHFGNLLTNYRFDNIGKTVRLLELEICGRTIPVSSGVYADHSAKLFAHQNSFNRLEISEGQGSALKNLGAALGEKVRIKYA